MTKIINAFHKDYVKTHHPEFLSGSKENKKAEVDMEDKKRRLLAVTEFYMFSKAGMPNGVK